MLLAHTASIDDTRYFDVYDEIVVKGDCPGRVGSFLQSLLVPGGRRYANTSWHAYAPGTRFDYSNMGATMAAHVAESVARRAVAAGYTLDLGFARSDTHLIDFNTLATALFASHWPSAGAASFYLANLTHLDIAVPSTHTATGEARDYCLYGYPDYPDGSFRASPSTYSYLLRTFINFGRAPDGHSVISSSTAAMMRNVSAGAGTLPGQGDEPQALIWYYSDTWVRGKWLLGHNGGDDGISTDAFFNPNTSVGFIVFTNGATLVAALTATRCEPSRLASWPPSTSPVVGYRPRPCRRAMARTRHR